MEKELNKINDPKELEKAKQGIAKLYRNLQQELPDNIKINKIDFYKDMILVPQNENNIALVEDTYIVEKKITREDEEDLITYELYDEEHNKMAYVDEDGKIRYEEKYLEILQERFKEFYDQIGIENDENTLEELLEKNKDTKNLEMTSEEIEEYIEEMKEKGLIDSKEQDEEKEQEQEEQKEEPEEEKQMNNVAKKMGLEKKDIKACTKIKPNERITDNKTFEQIAEINGEYEKVYVVAANSKTKGNTKFHFMGVTKDGEVEQIEGLEPKEGTSTGKKIININRDGSKVEEEQVSALFTVGGKNEGFSVNIGQYGIIEAQYIRRNPEKKDEYIGADINTQTQKPTTREVKEFMNTARNPRISEEIERAKKQIEEKGSNKTTLKDIDDNPNNDTEIDIDEEIELSDGKTTTLRKEAKQSDMSIKEYMKEYEEAEGEGIEERIENVREEKEEEQDDDERTPWGDAEQRRNRNM